LAAGAPRRHVIGCVGKSRVKIIVFLLDEFVRGVA